MTNALYQHNKTQAVVCAGNFPWLIQQLRYAGSRTAHKSRRLCSEPREATLERAALTGGLQEGLTEQPKCGESAVQAVIVYVYRDRDRDRD